MEKKEIKFRVYDLIVDPKTPFEMPVPIPYQLGFIRISQDPEGYRIEYERGNEWIEVSLEEIPNLLKQ